MKKLLLSIIVSLSAFAVNAQVTKDNVMIGANVADFNFQFEQQTTLGITPKAAWFIKDRVAIGGYANFVFNHVNGSNGNTFTYGVGPLARYYVLDDDINFLKQAKFFAEAHAGFEGSNNTVIDSNTNGLGIGFGPGIAYFLTPNIGLEALLKYNGVIGFGSETYKSGLNLSIGFQMYLPSKKLTNIWEEVKK